MHCFCNFNSINSNLSNRIELTPKDLQKSVGVISLLSAYQIFALTDSRGRLSLQNRCKFSYEKKPLAGLFFMILYSKRFLHLFDASVADALAVKIHGVIRAVAEDAGGLVFLQDDTVVIGKNFDGVLLLDIQNLSNFNGKHDSSQLVHLADYSGRFHDGLSFFNLKNNGAHSA